MKVTEYSLSLVEKKRLQKWLRIHNKKCELENHRRSISLCFTPTHIGVAVDAVCTCGRKKELTDYERW